MPKPAIDFISRFVDRMAFFAAIKFRNNGNHLFVAKALFINELVIANAGIVFAGFCYAVQNVFLTSRGEIMQRCPCF